MASTPVRNEPENTYTGISDFRRSVFQEGIESVDEKKGGSKLLKKARDNPLLPIGIFGGISALLYSGYKFKNRDRRTKLSVYLIHTRLAAQGAVVSCLAVGVLYSMFNDYILQKKSELPLPTTRSQLK